MLTYAAYYAFTPLFYAAATIDYFALHAACTRLTLSYTYA